MIRETIYHKNKNPMKYAIIEISGRQFWVEPGKYYDFHRIPTGLGKQITLNRVLLVNNDVKKPTLLNQEEFRRQNSDKFTSLLNYSKTEHIQLLKQQEYVELEDIVSDDKNYEMTPLDIDLNSKAVLLENHLKWELRFEFCDLIEKLLDKKINFDNFHNKFMERWEQVDESVESLIRNKILLTLNEENSIYFGYFILQIYHITASCYCSPGKFEWQGRTFIKELYYVMQKCIEKYY